jgi:hypothetical protein
MAWESRQAPVAAAQLETAGTRRPALTMNPCMATTLGPQVTDVKICNLQDRSTTSLTQAVLDPAADHAQAFMDDDGIEIRLPADPAPARRSHLG